MRRTKISKTHSETGLDPLDRYKWEFLRRNRGYQKDFSDLVCTYRDFFEKHGPWFMDLPNYAKFQPTDTGFFDKHISPEIKRIARKWGLGAAIHDPALSFDELFERRLPRPCFYQPRPFVEHMDLVNDGSEYVLNEVKEFVEWCAESKERTFRYQIVILDNLQPASDALHDVRICLHWGHKMYERVIGTPKVQPSKRLRSDKYEIYVRVWDLREQGFTFEDIARRVYPTEYTAQRKLLGRRSMPVVQKVRDDYVRATELISGEYKEIGAPPLVLGS